MLAMPASGKFPPERMKARRAHTVYLAPAAVALLRDLQAYGRPLPWVFPHPTRTDKPVSENALLYALAAMGFKDKHSGHGFRRMFSTLANESGLFRPDVIEAALAHKEHDDVRAAYNGAQYVAERQKLAAWYVSELHRLEAGTAAKVVGYPLMETPPSREEIARISAALAAQEIPKTANGF